MVMLNATKTQDEGELAGFSNVEAGYYHAAVINSEEKASPKKGTPSVAMEFQILADGLSPDRTRTIPGQVGKTISAMFAYASDKGGEATDRCIKNITRLALVTGIMQFGEEKEPDWADAIGRELVILIKDDMETIEDEVTGKKIKQKRGYTSVDWFSFWRLGHKDVANVPKDATTPGMQALGKQLVQAGNAAPSQPTQPQAAQQSSPPPQAAPAPQQGAAKSKWSDL